MSLLKIKHIIPVLSGKGGVGKSSVVTQLALSLSLAGYSVGVLDIDLTGSSIPRMFAIEDAKATQASTGWLPITVHPGIETDTGDIGPLRVMSLGFLLPYRGDAIVWRGPKTTAAVRQLLSNVNWDTLDYLIIDTPPCTSDEHISIVETLLQTTASNPASPDQLAGAVIVTTPQAVATADVHKELNLCVKVGMKVLGVVENMSGFVCPQCSECADLFSSTDGGGRLMTEESGARFFGSVPIDPKFGMLMESCNSPGAAIEGEGVGKNGAKEESTFLVQKYRSCSLAPIFKAITEKVVVAIGSANAGGEKK